jgi:hypothetical protein
MKKYSLNWKDPNERFDENHAKGKWEESRRHERDRKSVYICDESSQNKHEGNGLASSIFTDILKDIALAILAVVGLSILFGQ